jgi:hypothetical protein
MCLGSLHINDFLVGKLNRYLRKYSNYETMDNKFKTRDSTWNVSHETDCPVKVLIL